MNILEIVGRKSELFVQDRKNCEEKILSIIGGSNILVLGGAGSIGRAVSFELFKYNPRLLHVVDLSENNLVELTRQIRSSFSNSATIYDTFAIDVKSIELQRLFWENKYEFVLNLTALKHVRSEKDPLTLARMLEVNVINPITIFEQCGAHNVRNFFCVSTDKAANPTNLMGASKRLMELALLSHEYTRSHSLARFANVAFSDGSLLDGFTKRLELRQPLSAPCDIMRYFFTPKEAAHLCIFSLCFGRDGEIFFPSNYHELKLTGFKEIIEKFLRERGFSPVYLDNEYDAKNYKISQNPNKYPVYLFETDTSGEKPYEEFTTSKEKVDHTRFNEIGIVNNINLVSIDLDELKDTFEQIRSSRYTIVNDYKDFISKYVGEFTHIDTGKNLNMRM